MVSCRPPRFLALALPLLAGFFLCACDDDSPPTDDMSVADLVNPGGTIPCTSSAQCPANLPACHADSNTCVGCIDSFQTCGPMLTCNQATHTCVPADPSAPCKRNADCPRPGFDESTAVTCEIDAGMCYDCATDIDCVSATGGIGRCLDDHRCQADGGA